MTALLRTEGLTVRFGAVTAVDDVDLAVEAGRIVGLIGANGAGKTTFIDALTGFVPAAGRVLLDGRDVGGLPAHRRSRLGLGRTWQSQELFDDLSVADNLRVACERLTLGQTLRDLARPRRRAATTPAVEHALAQVGLERFADRMPGELGQAERKLVGVARALVAAPRVIGMDEPAAGLSTHESVALGERLRRVAQDGTALLLVDHDMGLVLGVCDYVYVLEFGRVIASGTPARVRSDPRVIASYLGEDARERGEAVGA